MTIEELRALREFGDFATAALLITWVMLRRSNRRRQQEQCGQKAEVAIVGPADGPPSSDVDDGA